MVVIAILINNHGDFQHNFFSAQGNAQLIMAAAAFTLTYIPKMKCDKN
jgi:hypothetical protein